MKFKYRYFLTKVLLMVSSLFLVACENNTFNAANTDIRTAEGLLKVQEDFDEPSGLVNGLDDASEGPSAVDGLSEAQITAVQDELDAIDVPEAISIGG